MYQIFHNDRLGKSVASMEEAKTWVPAQYESIEFRDKEGKASLMSDFEAVDHYRVVEPGGEVVHLFLDPAMMEQCSVEEPDRVETALYYNHSLVMMTGSLLDLQAMIPRHYVSPAWYPHIGHSTPLPDDLMTADHYRVEIGLVFEEPQTRECHTYFWVNAYAKEPQGPRWSTHTVCTPPHKQYLYSHQGNPSFQAQLCNQYLEIGGLSRRDVERFFKRCIPETHRLAFNGGKPPHWALLQQGTTDSISEERWNLTLLEQLEELRPARDQGPFGIYHYEHEVAIVTGLQAAREYIPHGYIEDTTGLFTLGDGGDIPLTHDHYIIGFPGKEGVISIATYYHHPHYTGQRTAQMDKMRFFWFVNHGEDEQIPYPSFYDPYQHLPEHARSVVDTPEGRALGLHPHEPLPDRSPDYTIYVLTELGTDLSEAPLRYHFYRQDPER